MEKKYMAGIEVKHSMPISRIDTDLLVDYISHIQYKYETYKFMEINTNEKRYLCIQVSKDSKIPRNLKLFFTDQKIKEVIVDHSDFSYLKINAINSIFPF